jgi:hypothetical protein
LAIGADAADLPKASCIDPHLSYIARALNKHDVYVEATIGPNKPPLRVTTSCLHVEPSSGFGFSKEFSCIGQGDSIIASTFGEGQSCRVTKVAPYVAQKDDFPLKMESKPDAAKTK